MAPRKGPARGRQDQAIDRSELLAAEQLVQRGMLGVNRDHLRTCGLCERHHELAAHHQRLFVGESEVDPLAERRHRGHQTRRADNPVEHQIGLGFGDQLH